MQKKLFLILVSIALFLSGLHIAGAQVAIPGETRLQWASISTSKLPAGNIDEAAIRDFGGTILGIAKLIISGFALVYIVLIGAYLIFYSDDEGEHKKQKKQMLYVIMGFIFLNIPGAVYNIFMNTKNKDVSSVSDWWEVNQNSLFWNSTGIFWLEGFLGGIIDFLKVIAFIVAIVMFTWGAFQLILSRGKDEYKETAQNRLLYGIMGLLFLGAVEVWARISIATDIQNQITEVAGKFFGLAFYFAAPVAIFFLMLGAYYYIMSGGDEKKAEKGKKIILYTFIATLILLASLSFISELTKIF